MPLVVTGSVGIDTIQTPDGEKRENVLGGSCTYFAAAASFFTRPRIVAVAGEDFPKEFLTTFEQFNVDTDGFEIRKGAKTFRWSGRYLENMDHRETITIALNVLGEAPPNVPEEYKDSQFVFLANGPTQNQREFLKRFPRRKLVVADTMDLWIKTTKNELLNLLKEVDGLVLNYDEAKELTRKKNAVAAAKHILRLGPRFVVVKKGEHGAILAHTDSIAALPAYPSEKVVDPTGAGDSFAGGMMGCLAASKDEDPGAFSSVLRAIAYGTVISSFTLEDYGLDRLRTLTKEQLHERYKEYSQMLSLM